MGRLFDAAAALTGVCTHASFEGQGPMWLEAACEDAGEATDLPLEMDKGGVLRIDWAALLPMLLDRTRPVQWRAAAFHASLARAIVQVARATHGARAFDVVGLTGGVFQNRVLAEAALQGLRDAGFRAHLPEWVPANDGGIAFGQIVESA
jgi:hydrogenase maturation protein HypF